MHKSLALMDNVDLWRPMIRIMTSVVGTTMQIAAVARKPTCPGSSIGMVWEDMLPLWLSKEHAGVKRPAREAVQVIILPESSYMTVMR